MTGLAKIDLVVIRKVVAVKKSSKGHLASIIANRNIFTAHKTLPKSYFGH
jgi:hypothetical protein